MKVIGSVKEDHSEEKRIAITPDIVKKITDLQFSIFLEKNYGTHLGINDEEYKNKGANFCNSAKEVLEKSEIILLEDFGSDLVYHHIGLYKYSTCLKLFQCAFDIILVIIS